MGGGTGTKALVEARTIPERVIEGLREVPHVTDVNRTDLGLVITMDEDVRSAIHGYLVYPGVEIQGLKLGEVTLEPPSSSSRAGIPGDSGASDSHARWDSGR